MAGGDCRIVSLGAFAPSRDTLSFLHGKHPHAKTQRREGLRDNHSPDFFPSRPSGDVLILLFVGASTLGPEMPLRETEAIVLRTYRLCEADKIVSLFTRQFGRLRAAAGGAQRTKSRYGGTLEPLSYIRLWLYERENRDLLRLNSAELL